MDNEQAFTILEHAIAYLSTHGYLDTSGDAEAIATLYTLYEAHKAIGPRGQIPSWERP